MNKSGKSKCQYCGDAPVNHAFTYAGGVVSMFLDPIFDSFSRFVPNFMIKFAEFVLLFIFHILKFFKIIRLSDDPKKAVTLRSRVIWDEARKRGIKMEQVKVFGKYTDNYRAKVNGKYIYFNSLPLPAFPFGMKDNWDDKFFLKKKFAPRGIPVPQCENISGSRRKRMELFEKLSKPLIIKPREGSRGRHTTTRIFSFEEFENAYWLAKEICPEAVAEEHLEGYVCRATCVGGRLAGFYRAEPPAITGDGEKTISRLIEEKDEKRNERVEKVKITEEMREHVRRSGFEMDDILPKGMRLRLSHRTGRLFGGATIEMLDELHPSFIPILEKAAKITGLSVAGLDCIIPDPKKDAGSQKWGIIECNTLPFIDLHYYALEGKPKNIAGMIWDLWYNREG